MKEIRRRETEMRDEKLRREIPVLSGLSIVLSAVVGVLLSDLCNGNGRMAYIGMKYGTVLFGGEAGGYVLAAVAAFTLGFAVTYMYVRARHINFRAGKK